MWKSTLLNILGLLDIEYKGKVLYDGKMISNESEKNRNEYIRNNINYLFQNYALIDTDTVYENLLLALEYEKLSKNEKNRKINEALELVDLKILMKKIFTLWRWTTKSCPSKSDIKKGNIILADEPTGNLDKENSNKVMNILKNFKRKEEQ